MKNDHSHISYLFPEGGVYEQCAPLPQLYKKAEQCSLKDPFFQKKKKKKNF
jgi:hypothetical protein